MGPPGARVHGGAVLTGPITEAAGALPLVQTRRAAVPLRWVPVEASAALRLGLFDALAGGRFLWTERAAATYRRRSVGFRHHVRGDRIQRDGVD